MSKLTAVCYWNLWNKNGVYNVVLIDDTVTGCIRRAPVDSDYNDFVGWVETQISDTVECKNDTILAAFCEKHCVSKVIAKHQDDTSYSIGEITKGLVHWTTL